MVGKGVDDHVALSEPRRPERLGEPLDIGRLHLINGPGGNKDTLDVFKRYSGNSAVRQVCPLHLQEVGLPGNGQFFQVFDRANLFGADTGLIEKLFHSRSVPVSVLYRLGKLQVEVLAAG